MPKDTLLKMRMDYADTRLESDCFDETLCREVINFRKYYNVLWELAQLEQFLSDRKLLGEFSEWTHDFIVSVNVEKEAIAKIDAQKRKEADGK